MRFFLFHPSVNVVYVIRLSLLLSILWKLLDVQLWNRFISSGLIHFYFSRNSMELKQRNLTSQGIQIFKQVLCKSSSTREQLKSPGFASRGAM